MLQGISKFGDRVPPHFSFKICFITIIRNTLLLSISTVNQIQDGGGRATNLGISAQNSYSQSQIIELEPRPPLKKTFFLVTSL